MPKDFSERVAQLVSRYGSVNATAKAIGIPQSTLDRIVRGERGLPRTETLDLIAQFFSTSIDWLVSGRGPAPPHLAQFKESTDWDGLVEEVAGKDEELRKILHQLPRSLELVLTYVTIPSFAGQYGDEEWDAQSLRAVLEARREERGAWAKLFRAWIDTVGVQEVRKLVRKHREELALRFAGKSSGTLP